jgi:hypothetical protein
MLRAPDGPAVYARWLSRREFTAGSPASEIDSSCCAGILASSEGGAMNRHRMMQWRRMRAQVAQRWWGPIGLTAVIGARPGIPPGSFMAPQGAAARPQSQPGPRPQRTPPDAPGRPATQSPPFVPFGARNRRPLRNVPPYIPQPGTFRSAGPDRTPPPNPPPFGPRPFPRDLQDQRMRPLRRPRPFPPG